MQNELTREQLLELKMGELREMYPHIKDNKKSDFVDKIMEAREATEILDPIEEEAIEEVIEEEEALEDEVVAADQPVSYEDAEKAVVARCCKKVKILLVARNSESKDKLFEDLSRVLVAKVEAKKKSVMTNRGSNEIHLDGKTFVKVTCPVRRQIAVRNHKYDLELKVL